MMPVETQRKTVTVGLVEPQEATQYAISMLIDGQPEFEMVGIESGGDAGIRMLMEHRPRIAIVEVDLEGRSGFEIAGDLAMRQRETKVIFYSSAMPDIYIDQAIRTKAVGYVLKTDSLANLLTAVQVVSKGGTFFSEDIRERISIDPVSGNTRAQFESRLSALSDRQLEVLRRLACGLSVKDVARDLRISVKAVDSHKYRLVQALDIHDRVDLARYAIREGLVCL